MIPEEPYREGFARPPKYTSRKGKPKKQAPAVAPAWQKCAGECGRLFLVGDLHQNLCPDCTPTYEGVRKVGRSRLPVREQRRLDMVRAMKSGQ